MTGSRFRLEKMLDIGSSTLLWKKPFNGDCDVRTTGQAINTTDRLMGVSTQLNRGRGRQSPRTCGGPSTESLNALWGAWVRWVFIDKRRTSISDCSPNANTRFQNQPVSVLELVNPVISG